MYSKTTWYNGDLITALKLNNIEDGVEDNSLSSAGEKLVSTFGQIANARVIYEDYNLVIESNNVGYPAAQSMCAIDDTHIAIAYIGYTNAGGSTAQMDTSKIKVINLEDGTYREGIMDLGHANSLTYNPDDNVIYCTPSSYPSDENLSAAHVKVIDYDTLTLTETVPMVLPDLNKGPTGIAYDRENKKIWMCNSIYAFRYDRSWNFEEKITLKNSVGTNQGMEVKDGYLIQPKGFSGAVGKGTSGSLIQIHSLADGELYKNINIPTVIDDVRVYEPEEVCIFPNGKAAMHSITKAEGHARITSVFGIGYAVGQVMQDTSLRRNYYIDSTSTGLGIGSESHPFQSIHQLYYRAMDNKRVVVKSIDDANAISFLSIKNLSFVFNKDCIVNAPELSFENCDVAFYSSGGYDTPYPSNITLKGMGNALVRIPLAADLSCYSPTVVIDSNIGGRLYITEGATVRARQAFTIGTLRIRRGGVMFLGDATYTTLQILDNGTLINPSANT